MVTSNINFVKRLYLRKAGSFLRLLLLRLSSDSDTALYRDDVITWKRFPYYWPFSRDTIGHPKQLAISGLPSQRPAKQSTLLWRHPIGIWVSSFAGRSERSQTQLWLWQHRTPGSWNPSGEPNQSIGMHYIWDMWGIFVLLIIYPKSIFYQNIWTYILAI